ncbi:hypothetical protein PV11_03701 [Exophiala sideris]|uniref:Dynamin-type G domain-containing protein n=1 Tax=Exophiala sideris TaxID=1016849 RepID=A0A0D1Z3V2_9EURO|nr:hypothetical protein PV11_03701 [Exophiala sideris]
MATATAADPQLSRGLQSEIMDLLDSFKDLGINHQVNVPQIIVCGDQSSGKSSVLEGITRFDFPIKGGLCTRFPTQLQLRSGQRVAIRAYVQPGPDRSESEARRLREWQLEIKNKSQYKNIFNDVAPVLGLGDTSNFVSDVLCIHAVGPSLPNLTFIDLPGLFQGIGEGQTLEDRKTVENIVRSFMSNPRSLIVGVLCGEDDIARNSVTTLMREYDPQGLRTIGVISKPDLLDRDEDRARSYMKLLNQGGGELSLSHGWFVVKSRNSQNMTISSEDRDAEESKFLSQGRWTTISSRQKGVKSLERQMSTVFGNLLKGQMPQLLQEIIARITQVRSKLASLPSPSLDHHFKDLLVRVVKSVQGIVTEAVNGTCKNAIFTQGPQQARKALRLRENLEDLVMEVKSELEIKGQAFYITGGPCDRGEIPDGAKTESYVALLEMQAEENESGGGTPGMFNEVATVNLFKNLADDWPQILEGFVEQVRKALRNFIGLVLDALLQGQGSPDALFEHVINPFLEQRCSILAQELQDLTSFEKPMTLSKNIKAQLASARIEEILRLVMPEQATSFSSFRQTNHGVDLQTLRQRFTPYIVTHQFAAAETIKCAEALYAMQLNKVIHALDFDKLDSIVLQHLPDCLTLEVVQNLGSSVFQSMFADLQVDTSERQQYEECLEMLNKAKDSIELFNSTGQGPSNGIERQSDHTNELNDIFHAPNKRALHRDNESDGSPSAKHPKLGDK